MSRKSTLSAVSGKAVIQKPDKPYPEFPLFAHNSGRWAKKVRGQLRYFGYWSKATDAGGGWQAALELYQKQADDLHAGRTPRASSDGLTIRDLANAYLTGKQDLLDNGEITPRTFADCRDTTDIIIGGFGKTRLVSDLRPDDFGTLRRRIAKTRGPVSLANTIQRIRSVFKWGYESRLIEAPVPFGPGFARPKAKVLRAERHKNGKKLFSAVEVKAMLAAASPCLKAMVLLAVNCGFGNADCGMVPIAAFDLGNGWVTYPRPKTAVQRRAALWPETVEAIRAWLAVRPKPKDEADAGLLFLTASGRSWHKDIADNPVAKETAKLLRELGIKRHGIGFYSLRHTFRTVADEAKDQPAAGYIMGHADPSMAAVYREDIGDDRLRAVTDHVRAWLFGDGGN